MAVESMDRTIPSKVDKAEAPTTQALVARSGSKTPDDAPVDVDLDLLSFAMTVS
jgi:hypothetical protein